MRHRHQAPGTSRQVTALTVTIVLAASCVPTTPLPAPEPATVAVQTTAPVDPDTRFIQQMIVHHQQALAMTALVPSRTASDDVRALAERMQVSQRDEIARMTRWLTARGAAVPDTNAHTKHEFHAHGMLTEQEMESLRNADDFDFDRLFLELMIRHHQGAVAMVEQLLASRGGAQTSELHQIASDINADQLAEIARMRPMLTASAAARDSVARVNAVFANDPRVGLRAGFEDAGTAAWNMALVAHRGRAPGFFNADTIADFDFGVTDLAFRGNLVFQGGYHGYHVWDVSNPDNPVLRTANVCPGGQGDISVYGNLLFISAQERRSRIDCGPQGVADSINTTDRIRGVRIFDISSLDAPRHLTSVQTCRGSHTHTLVADPRDRENVYVYVSGTNPVRPIEELAGCVADTTGVDTATAYFRIEVIRVPLARPQDARVISAPRLFADTATGRIAGLWPGGTHGPGTQSTSRTRSCHDITVYPEMGLGAGACSGNGILLDISDPANPRRIHEVIDRNFAFWHSATFNNDARKIVFTDEWGGGSAPRCRITDRREWGADAIFRVENRRLQFASYYKLPAPQADFENCVAHNGSLVPVPGRDIMVQGWYQGGVSVFDFTDPDRPFEIAYFDRGPYDDDPRTTGGYWSAYWYNGRIYGSEILRGLDVFRLTPSEHLSANEIRAAELVRQEEFNAQMQTKFTWPADFVVVRAYADQLARNPATAQLARSVLADVSRAEATSGVRRRTAALRLATRLERMARSSGDEARVSAMAEVLRRLAVSR